MLKVVRTVCFFSKTPDIRTENKLHEIEKRLIERDYAVQTKRICSPIDGFVKLHNMIRDKSILLSLGALDFQRTKKMLDDFAKAKNVAFNLDLTREEITDEYSGILFDIMKKSPSSTFTFTFTFNNLGSSPYFPSATYAQEGFSIGLQPTDLAKGCVSLEEWLCKMRECWFEIDALFANDEGYLGIDSSVAPLFEGDSSLIHFIKRVSPSFNDSVLSDTYLRITNFIKSENPRPVGLCGLMFPCLEDFELAEEYKKGNFTVERNVFLSLHSGLGIDTYPIGIDEDVRRVTDILKTVQGLSNKYAKPLSVRFVSDGKSKIGNTSNFKNQYLKDVMIRKL